MRADASPRRGPPGGGFALAEALAALAVSGAVLLGLFSLTDLVSRHARGVAERVEGAEATGRAVAALLREIGLAGRQRWAGPPTGGPFVFLGTADRLLFALDRPVAGPGAPTLAVQFQGASGPRGGELLRAEAALPPTGRELSDLAFAPARVLYSGRWRPRFAYVAAASATAPEIAVDAWDLPDAMPVAVRLSLTDPETGVSALDLRIPLRIEAEAGCASAARFRCSRPVDRDADEETSTAAIVNALQGRAR